MLGAMPANSGFFASARWDIPSPVDGVFASDSSLAGAVIARGR